MGNNQNQNYCDIDVTTQFEQLERLQTGLILKHKQTKLTYLLRQYTYASEMQYQQERTRLQREIAHPKSQNILGVYKIKTHTITGLCSTSHKIYAIYEYPQVSLQDEIIARRKENKRFDQNQLWSVLQSCNNALFSLKSSTSIYPNSVFINPEGQMKVLNNDMISQDYRFAIDRSYYYAPQKIYNFCKLDNQITLSKQAVFSMGMTLLQTALLETKLDCYDFEEMIFLEKQMCNSLDQLEGQYSSDLIQILDLMLNVNPNVRPSISQLQKLLNNYWTNVSQTNQKQAKNGQSLNIHVYDPQKRFLMISQQGVFKNLATVTSNQKQSIIRSDFNASPPNQIDKFYFKDKRKQSVKRQQLTKHRQSINSHQKQNLYTDPKLLQMIRKDLQCINYLKQSTPLKQTIKYSFLYPSNSIFQSVKDINLASKPHLTTNAKYLNEPLKQSNKQIFNISAQNSPFNPQFKTNTLTDLSKRSYMQSYNQNQIINNHKLVYCREIDNQGRKYQGCKLNGKKQGKGKLTFEDGVYYQGQFQNDQMNGRGVLYYKQNKPAYNGMWVNSQFHGLGTLYNENPQYLEGLFNFNDFDQVQDYWRKYEGEFYFDNKCGRGKLYLTNEQTIEGWFQNDMVNGQCQFKSKMGQVVRGIWQKNRLLQIHQ